MCVLCVSSEVLQWVISEASTQVAASPLFRRLAGRGVLLRFPVSMGFYTLFSL